MVSLNKQDGERERYSEDHSFMSGFYLGEAGEIQGQDIVAGVGGGPILASLFVYAF